MRMLSAVVPETSAKKVVRALEKSGFRWITRVRGEAGPGREAMDLLWLALKDEESEIAIRVAMEAMGAETGKGRLLISPVLDSWSLPAE